MGHRDRVHVWLGDVPSERMQRYMEEQYEDDDAPMNQFADEFYRGYYDHDFVERSEQPSSVPIRSLLQDHSYVNAYVDQVVEAAESLGIKKARTVILAFEKEIGPPSGDPGNKSEIVGLTYVGGFDFEG